jgi:hypothetical protein
LDNLRVNKCTCFFNEGQVIRVFGNLPGLEGFS